MASYIGIYLHATASEVCPGKIDVLYNDRPGGELHEYSIPLSHVARDADATDDEWIRDVLSAAIEAL